MDHYQKKQFTIAVVFVFIIVVIVLAVYFLFFQSKATCFDGIQNQGEKGIDCNGPCGPCPEDIREQLQIISQEIIPTLENNFDLIAKIKNPNKEWGVESLKYKFGTRQGEVYLLPQETKYIIEQKVSAESLNKIELELEEINWRKLKDFSELELKIKNQKQELTENGFNKLLGVVENKSNFDLDKIEVFGMLFSNGKIVAAGKTDVRTVLKGESRYFEIIWPYQISEVSSFEIKAYTNIFLNENFLKTHGTMEKFKEY